MASTLEPAALENLLRRDRALVIAGLVAITAVAWGYMFHLAAAMDMGPAAGPGMAMSAARLEPWTLADLVLAFVMWAVMMVAMMVPSAAPVILLFASTHRRQRQQGRPAVPTAVFVAGYLLVWAGFSALATGAQWGLHRLALLSPAMAGTSPLLGGALFVAAGVFQWTPLKHACLHHCRSPLAFFMTEWRPGAAGAFVMGLRHGVFCVGCCWLLMALLFAAGVMNLLWVATIAAFVLIEKVVPRGELIGRLAGGVLVALGIAMVAMGG